MKHLSQVKSFAALLNKGTLILLFSLFMVSFQGHATHYRYGDISWSRINTTTRTITVTVTLGYRYSYFSSTLPPGGYYPNGQPATFSAGTTLLFGDGGSVPIILTFNYANTNEDWLIGKFTTTYTYAGNATDFMLSFSGCCRSSSLKNGPDSSFNCESQVNLVAGNLGSPRSSSLPVVYVTQDLINFQAPASDANGGALSYSAPTFAQTNSTNPNFVSISPTGMITINAVGAEVGLWQAAFVITNAYGSTTVVDFSIQVVAGRIPVFDTPTSRTFNILPGDTLNFDVTASDVANPVTLTFTETHFLPPNVTFSATNVSFTPALPVTGNPVTTHFSFTPTAAQVGTHTYDFTATNSLGYFTLSTVTIMVGMGPQFIAPTKAEGSSHVIQSYMPYTDNISANNTDNFNSVQITSASIPNGATLTPTLPTTLSANPTTQMTWFPQPSDFGPHNVSFVATAPNGTIATRNYVLEVNTVPVFNSNIRNNTSISISPCTPYSNLIGAFDPDIPYGDQVEILVNTALPSWLTLTRVNATTILLSGTPTGADAGTYPIVIALEDQYHHITGIPTLSFNLVVSDSSLAFFNQVSSICAGATLAALPTTSLNGMQGTWSPALNNQATTTYTFRRLPSGCISARMTITVIPRTTTGSVTTSICAGQSYRWPVSGVTYTTSQSISRATGPCNIATLNLTVLPLTSTGSVTTTACGSYTWPANGVTYTTSQSGLTVVSGCNTATLNLTMSPNPQTFYADADADGFGNAASTIISCSGLPANASTNSTDCNDLLAGVNPNASEILGNGIDDNCNGITDEVTPLSYLIPTNCGATLANLANTLFAQPIFGAQGYRFRVTNGTNVRTLDSATSGFALTSLSGSSNYATPYTIDVSVKLNGYYGAYGNTCIVNTPAVPPTTNVSNPACGSTLTTIAATIFCTADPNASAYRFRLRNAGVTLGMFDTTVNRCSLTSFAGIQFGTTYTVDVLLQFAGIWRPDTEFGPPCLITTPDMPEPSRVIQPVCGSSISSLWTTIFAQQVIGAQGYKFVVNDGIQTREYATPNSRFQLRYLAGGVVANTTYTIRVDVLYNSSYVQGVQTCQIITSPTATRQTSTSLSIFEAQATPNPFADHFKINLNTSSEEQVLVRVYDMMGREIESRLTSVDFMDNFEIGNRYSSGVYNVLITQADQLKTLRIIKR